MFIGKDGKEYTGPAGAERGPIGCEAPRRGRWKSSPSRGAEGQ